MVPVARHRREPGSSLVTASGAVRRPGVCEIAIGTRIDTLLDAAGGPSADLSAVLIGGYFGTWMRSEDALGMHLTNDDLIGPAAHWDVASSSRCPSRRARSSRRPACCAIWPRRPPVSAGRA